MESDNYIDSLSVSLNLPSEYSPSKAQEEADSIVDQYVIPAVESVVEEMGQEMEARIPLVEIDVGRVRLQDLRDAIESSLRNALDRYRSSEFVEAESSVENVKEFAETGLAPWENGDVPFNPFLFLKDNLKKDSDAIRDSLVTFSEKELVSLLMATFQNTTSSSEVSPVLQLQDAVFDRLSLGFPETASALTARLSSWRRYRSIPEKRLSTTLGNVPYDNEPLNVSVPALQTDTLSESVITSSAEPDRESAPSPSRSVFKYVEISMRDVPEGHSVEVSNYVGIPDAHSPEYIMVLGNPNRCYRKVATDTMENRILSPADGANGAGTGLSGRETEIRPMRDQEDTEPVGSNDTESVIPSSAEPDRESVPSPSRSVFKYVEISMRDIPEGHSVEVSDYVGISDVHSPAYIMVLGNPNRFFRKVATDTMGNSILSPTDDAIGAGADLSERETRINPMRDQEDAEAVGSANTNSVISSSAEPDREPVPSPSRLVFKYVEISMRDIPEGNSIELGDYREDPTDNDPEFIMTFGHPTKFFKKVAVETKTVSSLQSESEQAWPDTGVLISDNYDNRNAQESPDVWTPRDFESEVTDARIPVSDAGLVLLHPFMARMMENLGLVEKGTFVSHLARVRAVHLLRDLTGSEEPHHNHNLILEKILCGLPVGYALPPEWEPTDREKEETEALLQAVCDYWKPLSGSSTAALCGGFILRPGTIERFEESWTIRVEGRTIDILMDDLPWEISVIFLPWLGKPIGVEWQQE